MQVYFKRFLCGLLLLLLLLPALQAKFHWAEEVPLNGAYRLAPRAEFSGAALVSNRYQPALEKYLEDRLGFRSFLIRLRNQVGHSIFSESWAERLAVGRANALFEREYIDAYLGIDFVGEAEIRFNARRLRSVQDSLARHGVQLVFVIAPSKATFMPENLPRYVQGQPRTRTNYAAYAQALPAAGVHLLDFSRAFRQWKRTSPHPLFASGGVHWSLYGGVRAADSLRTYLQQWLRITPAPFRITEYELSTDPRGTDNDIAKTLNLFWLPHSEELAYPALEFLSLPAGQAKPNLLFTADSFGWTWVNNDFFGRSFSEQSHFWYYNSEIARPESPPESQDPSPLKTREQYLARDVIVVMYNERNLLNFDNGFSREVYNIFHPFTDVDHARYAELIARFRREATWEEGTQPGFDREISDKANAILDRER